MPGGFSSSTAGARPSAGSAGGARDVTDARSRTALPAYLEALESLSLLTPEEECALGRRARRGCARARAQMITSNLRLVVHVARQFTGRGVSLEDLIGEGNLGLIRAVERFDPELGYRFSTYGVWWIRRAVVQALADLGRPVRLPVDILRRLWRLLEAERSLMQRLGRAPDEGELARRLGVSLEMVHRLQGLRAGTLSLDACSTSDEGGRSLIERLPGPGDPAEAAQRRRMRAEMDRWLRALPALEELVLRARYGFLDGRCRSLGELGRRLGRSRESVRQTELRALRRLHGLILEGSPALSHAGPVESATAADEAAVLLEA